MKVVYIVTTVDGYGADKSIVNNILYLKKNKLVDPYVVIPYSGEIERVLQSNNIDYVMCKHLSWFAGHKWFFNKNGKRWLKTFYNKIQALILFKQINKRGSIDFVHTNTMTTNFGIFLSKALKSRHIMHIRELPIEQFDWMYEYGEKETLHFIEKYSAAVVANSEYVANKFRMLVQNVGVINNGIFEANLIINPNKYDFGNGLRMICAGRLEEDKGHFDAIKAVGVLKSAGYTKNDIKLDIYGDGSMASEFRRYIQQEGLESMITMIPFDKDLVSKMKKYNIGLICSRYEAFGRTTIEYLGSGLTVIGNETGNTPNLIQNEYNGLISKYGNPEDLAQKIVTLISNKELIRNYGEKGFQSVRRGFSIEDSSLQMMKLYNEVL